MKLKQNKLGVRDLKKELKNFSQKELSNLLIDCYKISDEVKTYLSVKFLDQAVIHEIYEITKKKIQDEFFPDRGFGKLKLANAKKAISDFKKICNDEEKLIDLMVFYVEMGVEFTNEFGDIDESFYNSMESMYESVVNVLNEKEEPSFFLAFKDRLENIVHNTDGIGWGFHDYLHGKYLEINWLNEENEG